MAAAEGGVHQLTRIRVARMGFDLGAVFDGLDDASHVRQIDLGIHTLRIQIHRAGHQVHVAGALAVAEQRSLDPVGARQQAELGSRHPATAIVVRMQADVTFARGARCARIHSIVGVNVGRAHRQSPGRLMIPPLSVSGRHPDHGVDASAANSSSVPVKLSGEYSNVHSVSGARAAQALTHSAP